MVGSISPNWVVEDESLGFRVALANPNPYDLTLDTTSVLELPGLGYSVALSGPTDLAAGGHETLIFQRGQVPSGTLGNQNPSLGAQRHDGRRRTLLVYHRPRRQCRERAAEWLGPG